MQMKMWEFWTEFWDVHVPALTHGEPYDILNNGDVLDGVPHGAVGLISHDIQDQANLAVRVLEPIVDKCLASGGTYYHIRGTEAHIGKGAQDEERVAQRLGAKPNDVGQYARWDLWKYVGKGLIHAMHHVGTTGSRAYEATAVHKELVEEWVEAATNGERAPDVIVRSHRHRCMWTGIPSNLIDGVEDSQAIVTPGWQAKTPFVWKIPGGRLSTPQFGGIVIRQHPEGVLYVRKKVWKIHRSPAD